MRTRDRSLPLVAMLVSSAGLAGCATDEPIAYADVASSAYLAPAADDQTARTPLRYSAQADWRQYDKVMIDPVVIYKGRDQQFGDMPDSERDQLAQYMQQQFSSRLAKHFSVVQRPGPNTLRVKLTLTGATKNTPGLATLSRFDVAGAVYNGVQTIRDGEGAFTGAVKYVVEVHDAKTGKLLSAFTAKQYPKPYDLPAGVGALAAAKAGIDRGSEEFVAQLK